MVDSTLISNLHCNMINCCSNLSRDRSPPAKFRKIQFSKLNSSSEENIVQKCLPTLNLDSEVNELIGTIQPSELAEKLEASENSIIVLDMRSACNFCRLHIRTATLVSCSSKLKVRRAIQIVTDIIKTSPNLSEIIVYTEHGFPIRKEDHISSLVQFLLSYSISCLYLTGGLKKFESQFPKYCESGSIPSLCLQMPKSIPDVSDIYFTDASQILPFLFLGNEFDAQNNHFLTSNKISHILNLTMTVQFLDEISFKSKRIDCKDNHAQDLTSIFPESFVFIEEARQSQGRVLVHCQAGVSRSASVVIAYLMAHCGSLRDLNSAHQWVKRRRSIISPNFSFMGQLIQFEQDLCSGSARRCSVLQLDPSASPTTGGHDTVTLG